MDVDFRFYEPQAIAEAMERVGLRTEMHLERLSYPGEVETRRAYLLARRQPLIRGKKIKQWVFYKRDEDRIARAKEALASDW